MVKRPSTGVETARPPCVDQPTAHLTNMDVSSSCDLTTRLDAWIALHLLRFFMQAMRKYD